MATPPSPPSFATPLPFSSYRCFGLPWYWRGRSPGSPSKVLTWYQGAPGTPADIETAQPVSRQGLGPLPASCRCSPCIVSLHSSPAATEYRTRTASFRTLAMRTASPRSRTAALGRHGVGSSRVMQGMQAPCRCFTRAAPPSGTPFHPATSRAHPGVPCSTRLIASRRESSSPPRLASIGPFTSAASYSRGAGASATLATWW